MECITQNIRKSIITSVSALLSAGALICLSGSPRQARAADESQSQTRKELSHSAQLDNAGEVACRFAAVPYPEGTVIHGDRVPEQMCVRAPNPSANSQTQ